MEREARPIGWLAVPSCLDEPLHTTTVPREGLQQLQHALVGTARLPGQIPRDRVGQMEITEHDGIGVTERTLLKATGGPRTETGEREDPTAEPPPAAWMLPPRVG